MGQLCWVLDEVLNFFKGILKSLIRLKKINRQINDVYMHAFEIVIFDMYGFMFTHYFGSPINNKNQYDNK